MKKFEALVGDGNLYALLTEIDIVDALKHDLANGSYEMDAHGKIQLKGRIVSERPWISNRNSMERDCSLWHEVYFNKFGIVPSGCRKCWKISWKPRTLEEVFRVVELQEDKEYAAKVGCERRSYTGNRGGYAAFWYSPLTTDLSEPRFSSPISIRKEVSVMLAKEWGVEDKDVILKRGCTEMEMRYYPSSSWDKYAEAWDRKEALLNSVFVTDPDRVEKAPAVMEVNTVKLFIEHAFEYGDQTYLKYTGGRRLVPDYECYDSPTRNKPLIEEIAHVANNC